MVLMMPFGVTMRMTLFAVSAIYTLPAESVATPAGSFSMAKVAGPLSPLNPFWPQDAREYGHGAGSNREAPDHLVPDIGNVDELAGGIDSHPRRIRQRVER